MTLNLRIVEHKEDYQHFSNFDELNEYHESIDILGKYFPYQSGYDYNRFLLKCKRRSQKYKQNNLICCFLCQSIEHLYLFTKNKHNLVLCSTCV